MEKHLKSFFSVAVGVTAAVTTGAASLTGVLGLVFSLVTTAGRRLEPTGECAIGSSLRFRDETIGLAASCQGAAAGDVKKAADATVVDDADVKIFRLAIDSKSSLGKVRKRPIGGLGGTLFVAMGSSAVVGRSENVVFASGEVLNML